MDISEEIENLLTTIKVLSKDSEEYLKVSRTSLYPESNTTSILNDIIDVAQINFDDDETWLYKIEGDSNVTDINAWLHEDTEILKDLDFHTKHLTLMREMTKLDSSKKIDSRTFTRPKKRFSRPSLNFNDSCFKLPEFTHNNIEESSGVEISENAVERKPAVGAPLNFDLSEPTNNHFNNISKAENDLNLFQNMSPPSLVSSSMFSSIMENSYIKNDPVLREIRDTDYTDVILQGCDSSLLKSFTGSCSSIDSDTPEGFLRRSVETTFIKKDISSDSNSDTILNETYSASNTVLNNTYQKESGNNQSGCFTHLEQGTGTNSSNDSYSNKSSSALNSTYRKNTKENLNDTFNVIKNNHNPSITKEDLNQTIIINNGDNIDSNRLSYNKRRSCIIEEAKCDSKYSTFSKRSSLGCSLGSSDSLDCASSLSNSSSGKGSSKMLNMAEVDAIVLQQEQSLQQVMSTPKAFSKYANTLSEYTSISPIRQLNQGDRASDSEASSNDDYLTVGSGSSKSVTSSGNSDTIMLPPSKIVNHIKNVKNKISIAVSKNIEPPKKTTLNRNIQYGSYTNLHKAKIMAQQGSQKNIAVGNGSKNAQSNLISMDSKLRSSYTQLKPVFSNLPATVNGNPKGFGNVAKMKVPQGTLKIAEVAPTLRDQPKPAPVANAKITNKPSGLPRPVSGIPRPAGTKIPGPQSLRSGIALSRPTSRVNIDADF